MEIVILSAALVSSFGMALAFERVALNALFRLLERRATT
jgi:hypothetical protein